MVNKKQTKILNLSIKILIVALAIFFVIKKISHKQDLIAFKSLISEIHSTKIWWTMSLVIFFMLINWLLEVFKWQYLSKAFERLSFSKALTSVLCGLTWAIITPNRIGEYGGRILILEPQNRAKGAVAMGVGLFAQLVLTSIFGALSIAWFTQTFLPTPLPVQIALWLLAAIYSLTFVVLFFNVDWVDTLIGKIKWLRKIKPFISVLKDFKTHDLMIVLAFSLARFVIFTSQYVILMLVILPDIPVMPMIMMIFILFFIQSAIPSLDIFDFSVRSFVASNLFIYITTQDIAVMAIVSCIWFINLIFPAIIGTFFVARVNYIYSNGN